MLLGIWPQLIVGLLTVYCLTAFVKHVSKGTDLNLPKGVFKGYFAIWAVAACFNTYYGHLISWWGEGASEGLLTVIATAARVGLVALYLLELFLIVKALRASLDAKEEKWISFLFLGVTSWKFLGQVFMVVGNPTIIYNFAFYALVGAAQIALFGLLARSFKLLDLQADEAFQKQTANYEVLDSSGYSQVDLASMCDRCHNKIPAQAWSRASFSSNKLVCGHCGGVYEIKYWNSVGVKLVCIVVPFALIPNMALKYAAAFGLLGLATLAVNKSWYDLKGKREVKKVGNL